MIQPRPPGPVHQPAFFAGPIVRPAEQQPRSRARREQKRVLACLGSSPNGPAVIGHATAVARSLDLPVTVARVLDMPTPFGTPADPVEWQQRRRLGREELAHLAESGAVGAPEMESILLCGRPDRELNRWAADHGVSLMVIGTEDLSDRMLGSRGPTATAMLASTESSLLLVPPLAASDRQPAYRRLLVPLDGSARAESVLPIAIRIARARNSELVLAHVVPPLKIVRSASVEAETRELLDQLEKRNDETARSYLEKLQRGMDQESFPVRTVVTRNGDPRPELRRLALTEAADLIVLASHGASGLTDVPWGSVTEYLATHAPAPLLIVRSNFTAGFPEKAAKAKQPVEAALH